MELLKRLVVEEDAQGLVEYTLIVLLVALVFWVAIKNTNVGVSWRVAGARLRLALAILRVAQRPRKLVYQYCCEPLGLETGLYPSPSQARV